MDNVVYLTSKVKAALTKASKNGRFDVNSDPVVDAALKLIVTSISQHDGHIVVFSDDDGKVDNGVHIQSLEQLTVLNHALSNKCSELAAELRSSQVKLTFFQSLAEELLDSSEISDRHKDYMQVLKEEATASSTLSEVLSELGGRIIE